MARVVLTKHLHQFFPRLAELEAGEKGLAVEGTTVAEVVRGIEALLPGFTFYVCDERGRLRRHVNIFVEDESIADRKALTDEVGPGSRVFIMQSLSGG